MRHLYNALYLSLVTVSKRTIFSTTSQLRLANNSSTLFYGQIKRFCINSALNFPFLKEVQGDSETWRYAWITDDSMSHTVETNKDADLEIAYAWIHLDAAQNDRQYSELRGEELISRACYALDSIIDQAEKKPGQFNKHLSWIMKEVSDYLASTKEKAYRLNAKDAALLHQLRTRCESVVQTKKPDPFEPGFQTHLN